MADDRRGPSQRLTLTRSREQAERLLSWYPEAQYPTVRTEQDAWLRLYEQECERRQRGLEPLDIVYLASQLPTEWLVQIGINVIGDRPADELVRGLMLQLDALHNSYGDELDKPRLHQLIEEL